MRKYNTSPGLSRGLTWALHNNLWRISSLTRARCLAVGWGDWIRCCLTSLTISAFYGSLNVSPTDVTSRFKKARNHLPSSLKVNRYLHPRDWRCFSHPHVPMKRLGSASDWRLGVSVSVVRRRQCVSQTPMWCWCCWSSKCNSAKHTGGPLSPCLKGPCGSHEGSEKGQAAEHPAEEAPETAAHTLLVTFRHFCGTWCRRCSQVLKDSGGVLSSTI